ncbi:MAG: hypothetical protein FRX48_04586 [Lasallia pustulata]|uniref:Uncharacterized protein n=1 Tax=Lasallia pustulata TaxID=136370 RepID=A0A1W5CTC7_9LECA|nr:MAG: hypothetical protein FRX48_04586 [Lasallia pustulata]SLM34107.1 hypothetical protein LPUS_02789 [Lasallia pustulata]
MTMVDSRGSGPFQFPSRKPIAQSRSFVNHDGLEPLTKIVPDSHSPPAARQHQASYPAHRHSRTSSSPLTHESAPSSNTSYSQSSYQSTMNNARRTPSNATSSTHPPSPSNNGFIPGRTPSTVSVSLRRSISSRSGGSITPSSYVALMRKQKATVWCDRAQHEDPRIVAQQKAAKMRATMEVVGGGHLNRNSMTGSLGSGGVRSKIRHHGAPKAVGYTPGNLVGGGIPMRLSANEVGEEGNSDDDWDSQRNPYHQRTASGRSSMGSNSRLAAINQRAPGRYSQGSTPPSGQGHSPVDDIPELSEPPVPGQYHQGAGADYFTAPSGNGGSGSSSEREASFGNVGNMNAPAVMSSRREDIGKSSEELRRRGSVDDRAGTMTGVLKLFVANPDLSD